MSDLTATQKGARLMARLLMHGPVRAAQEATRLGISVQRMYQILDEVSVLSEAPLINDRGWWYVEFLQSTDYERALAVLNLLRGLPARGPR